MNGKTMEYATLGRTGLKVSVAGLGCGSSSRLGLTAGHSEAHCAGIIRQAVDLGVNLIDTAIVFNDVFVRRALTLRAFDATTQQRIIRTRDDRPVIKNRGGNHKWNV